MSDKTLVPDFKVSANGSPLSEALRETLRVIEVKQSIRLIDMAVLTFDNPDGVVGDADEFAKGNEIEIQVGYMGEIGWAFKGDIVSLEPIFPMGGTPTVVVRAYDRMHRYRRGKKSRTFLNQKVSDVISTLAGEDGLSADVEATDTQLDYLLQNNQTNIDYIQELARRAGFTVSASDDGSKLSVKKPPTDQGKGFTYTYGKDSAFKSFYVRKSLSNVPTEVSTRYWDMKKKESVTETVKDLHGSLGGDAVTKEAEDAFGKASTQISVRPNMAPAEASAMAASVLNEAALGAVRGRGTATGEPQIQPGLVLELLGLGGTWSGTYFVTGATHLLHRLGGYTTQFEVRRTGTGE